MISSGKVPVHTLSLLPGNLRLEIIVKLGNLQPVIAKVQ